MISRHQCIAMALAITALPVASYAADPRPCELLTSSEVASILGSAPGRGDAEGPDVDKERGTTSWTCGWMVQQPEVRYLGVSAIRGRSVAEATRGMNDMLEVSRGLPEGMQMKAVAGGPGEQAAWGSTEEGTVWVTRTGAMIVVIVMAVEQKDLESQREPLRKLLVAALGRL